MTKKRFLQICKEEQFPEDALPVAEHTWDSAHLWIDNADEETVRTMLRKVIAELSSPEFQRSVDSFCLNIIARRQASMN